MRRLGFALLALCGALMAAPAALGAGSGGGGGDVLIPRGPDIDPGAEYRAGLHALQAQQYPDAISHFRAALRVTPNHAMTNYLYGLALIGNNDSGAARRPLERAVRDSATPPDAWLQLGLVYLQAHDREHAQDQLTALTAMLSGCGATCGDERRQLIQNAHDQLQHALEQGGDPAQPTTGWLPPGDADGRALFAEAVGYINAQRYADALVTLERAQAVIGPQPDVLNYMGFANRKLGHYSEALGYYGQALLIDPHHRGANEYLGELYLEMGRMGEARHQLAVLDGLCPYGCAEREELARWISLASN